MFSKTIRLTMLVALAGSLLAGCAGAAAPSVPTIDVKPTIDAASTLAVETAAAQFANNAPAAVEVQPTVDINAVSTMAVETAVAQFTKDAPAPVTAVEPTATAVPPTPTVVVNPPTATLVPPAPASGGTVATAVPPSCSIVDRSPAPATQFAALEDFDGRWVVKNTSGKVWHAQETDIKFMYGNKVHLGADIMDLASDLQSGEKVTINIDMKAPSTSGHYSSTWGIYSVGNLVCTLSVYFDVK